VLLLTAHHIVTDGWSMGVLVDELSMLYGAAVRSEETALPPPESQYADFAVWQRKRFADGALDGQLDYWKRQLAGVTPLQLPTDRPRPAVRTSTGAVHEFVVPAGTSARLRDLARAEGTTVFAVLVAACQALLARYAGQDDVAVGTVFAGRNRPELQNVVGFFATTLVLRSTVDGSRTFAELLSCVKETVLDAIAHDEAPFERIVEAVRTDRDVSRNPLFDAMVVLHSQQRELPAFTGLRVEEIALPRRTATFDLSFDFREYDDVVAGLLEYNTDLFDAETAVRLAEHLVVLLDGVTREPDRPLGGVSLLAGDERRRVLVEWNDTALDVPAVPFPAVFEAQAARTPDVTALVFRETALSFAELNARANRLAHHLVGLGVGPERLVALALPRTADMVVAILAVLKAGGAYLPVDPDLPAERIGFLLDDARPALVVTASSGGSVPNSAARLVLDAPDTRTALERCPDTDPTDADRICPLSPAHPAYVIYTSGSTGRPKGVVVEHRALTNLLYSHRADWAAAAGPGARLRAALTAVFSFDTSWEGLLFMAGGHELHLIDDTVRMDADALVDYVAELRPATAAGRPAERRAAPPAGADAGRRGDG
jgi:non-ribosomal peptide synthetase component F